MKMNVDEWWWRNWKKVIVKKIKDGETEVKCPKLSKLLKQYLKIRKSIMIWSDRKWQKTEEKWRKSKRKDGETEVKGHKKESWV